MTIEASPTEKSYLGDGVSLAFAIPFKFDTASDIKVTTTDPSGNVGVLSSGFTISGGGGSTGLCTFAAAPAIGVTISLFDNLIFTQPTDYTDADPFPAETHERALDRCVRQSKRLSQELGRCLRYADGEPADGTIGNAAARKGKYLFWNATTGFLEAAAAVGTTTLSASIIGMMIFPITNAEAAAGVTPTDQTYRAGYLERYGGGNDGVVDNVNPMIKALAQAAQPGGANPVTSAGTWNFNSALFPMVLPSNVTIKGAGMNSCKWVVTGTGPAYMFTSLNKTRIAFDGIWVTGNSQSAVAYADGGFWWCQQDNTATAVGHTYRFENSKLENFKGSYWCWFLNTSSTYTMRNFFFTGGAYVSAAGNSRAPSTSGEASTILAFQGSATSGNGLVADIFVDHNWSECTYVKCFLNIWHGTLRTKASHNIVFNAGLVGGADDKGCYGLMAYDNSLGAGGAAPDFVDFADNEIIAPRDCGVYFANVSRGKIGGGVISGQTSLLDGTLPKGAIALNACGKIDIVGVTMYENAIGVEMVADNTLISDYYMASCTMKSGIASALGVKVSATAAAGNTSKVNLEVNDIKLTSVTSIGINNTVTSASSMLSYNVNGNTVDAARGIIGQGVTSPNILYTSITANKLLNAQTFALSWANSTTGAVDISENKFLGGWGSACVLMAVSATTKLSCKNNVMQNMTSGTGMAFQGVGAQGVLMGNSFVNVSPAYRVSNAGSDLGRTTPAWTGVQGDIVQDFVTQELGSAASKYTRQSWAYGTAWLEQRCLTGN